MKFPAVVLCMALAVSGLTGCTPKQSTDLKTKIAKISAYEPELIVAVDTVASVVATFDPKDADLIASEQGKFNAIAAQLKSACDAYVAQPSPDTLTNIRTILTTLLDTNGDQFLAAARIVDPKSVASAKLAIGAVRTILLLMDSELQTTQTPAQTAALAQARTLKLATVAPYLDKQRVQQATGVPFGVALRYEQSLGF